MNLYSLLVNVSTYEFVINIKTPAAVCITTS